MEEITYLSIILSILWFLVYWILGGVFFALMTLLRLGRVRKVRFSCLFSVLALICGVGAAWIGVSVAEDALVRCLQDAQSGAEMLGAVFGCGFVGVIGVWAIGMAVLILGGFIIMAASKPKSEPWLTLEDTSQPDTLDSEAKEQDYQKSKFF